MDRRFFFRKDERLSGVKPVQLLFTESAGSIFIFPLKLNWRFREATETEPNIKLLVTVSKKRMKRAHDRNRVKRILREVYRKNKAGLSEVLDKKQLHIDLSLSFVSENHLHINEVERIFLSIAHRFVKQLDAHVSSNPII